MFFEVQETVFQSNQFMDVQWIHNAGSDQWRTQDFFFTGVQQIQLRTENGDLGAVAPYPLVKGSGSSRNLVQEISFHTVKVS
jgi:hypothetical protein